MILTLDSHAARRKVHTRPAQHTRVIQKFTGAQASKKYTEKYWSYRLASCRWVRVHPANKKYKSIHEAFIHRQMMNWRREKGKVNPLTLYPCDTHPYLFTTVKKKSAQTTKHKLWNLEQNAQ